MWELRMKGVSPGRQIGGRRCRRGMDDMVTMQGLGCDGQVRFLDRSGSFFQEQ